MKYLILLTTVFFGMQVCGQEADESTLTKVGDKAPVFKALTIEGKEINTAKLKGKILMVNFMATWCPPCNKELPVLQAEIWEKYKDHPDFVLLVVGREHTAEELQKFAKEKGLDLPFAPDPERGIFSLFATQSIPRNYIMDKKGKILYQSIGYTEEEFGKIIKLLAEELK